jgi:hypothetical protein
MRLSMQSFILKRLGPAYRPLLIYRPSTVIRVTRSHYGMPLTERPRHCSAGQWKGFIRSRFFRTLKAPAEGAGRAFP